MLQRLLLSSVSAIDYRNRHRLTIPVRPPTLRPVRLLGGRDSRVRVSFDETEINGSEGDYLGDYWCQCFFRRKKH